MDRRRHCGAAPEAHRVTLPGSRTREGRRPGASIRPCPAWPGTTRIPIAFRTRDIRSKRAEFVRSREARRGRGWRMSGRTRGKERGKPSTAALSMGSGSWTGGATAALPLKPIGSPSRGAGRGKAGGPAPRSGHVRRGREPREYRSRSEHGTSDRSERNSSDPARHVVGGAGG